MKKLELERRKADLTQQQLAELVGVTSGAVSMWERGATIPRSDRLIIIPCSDCSNAIEAVKKRDGSIWKAKEMVAYSTSRFGRPLCAACMKAVQKAEAAKEKLAAYGT